MENPTTTEELAESDHSSTVLDSFMSDVEYKSTLVKSDTCPPSRNIFVPQVADSNIEYTAARQNITPTKQKKRKVNSDALRTPQSPRVTARTDAFEEQNLELIERIKQISEDIVKNKVTSDKPPTKSPFFSPPASAKKLRRSPSKEKLLRHKASTASCIPFPPLSTPNFGLLQEKLFRDPFRLLIGVTFLNRTKGKDAIPVFYKLMEKYPTTADILAAKRDDIIALQHHLGFQTQRADTYQKYAHFWIHDPPFKGKRYRVDHYPNPGDGMDVKKGEVINDADPRSAWEIGHITQGRYAIDSWRIFCRDILRGESDGWNGERRDDGFQPEWMRVQPQDKELIAFLRWMWLKEGFVWDPLTGEKEVAGKELMEAAIAGKIVWDDVDGMKIVDGMEETLNIATDDGKQAKI